MKFSELYRLYLSPSGGVCSIMLASIFQNTASIATAGMFATTWCGCRGVYYLCHMLCMCGFIYFIVFHNAIEQVHFSSGWTGPFNVFWTSHTESTFCKLDKLTEEPNTINLLSSCMLLMILQVWEKWWSLAPEGVMHDLQALLFHRLLQRWLFI